jgi:Flp pilus assembly protein TadG
MKFSTLRNDRGSAFVELALVLPILTLVLIGAAELGRMAYFAIEVSDAARAGVAYGAQSAATAPDTVNIAIAARAAAPDLPSTLSVSSNDPCTCETVTTSTGTVTTTPIPLSSCGGSSTPATLCPPSTTTGTATFVVNYVQVSTSATVSTMFNYPGIPSSFTLNGFSKMRVLQ